MTAPRELTLIGGRVVRCSRCGRLDTMHSSVIVYPDRWCNACQAMTSCETWICLYVPAKEPSETKIDLMRRACAARGALDLGMKPGVLRFVAPMCALDRGHAGEHEDDITRERWA